MSQGSVGTAAKRLQEELHELVLSDVEGISAFPENDDIFTWLASIQGVAGTPYEGLEYQLRITFPENYPYRPPQVLFVTPCFHPNVDEYGNLCLDILKEKWASVHSVSSILLSIQTLLNDPNNSSPLNFTAAQLWDDKENYRQSVLLTFDSQGRKK